MEPQEGKNRTFQEHFDALSDPDKLLFASMLFADLIRQATGNAEVIMVYRPRTGGMTLNTNITDDAQVRYILRQLCEKPAKNRQKYLVETSLDGKMAFNDITEDKVN